jgi:nitrate reductase NapA
MNINRREFIKQSALASLATMAAASCSKKSAPKKATVKDLMKDESITWQKTPCRFCGTGCGVMLGAKNDRIVAMRGDENCFSNKGLNCIKGYFLTKIMYGEDRLTKPLIRKNGKLEEAEWEETLDLIASKYKKILAEKGSDAVAMWGSGQWTIFEGYTALKFMKGGLGKIAKNKMGSNHIDPNARLCMASAVGAFMRTFGSDEPMGSYEDLEHADVFVTWGANMAECHPVLYSRLIDTRLKKGAKHIDLSVAKTRTAEEADLFLEFKPQTDLAIANFFANYILQNNLQNDEFIEQNTVFKVGKTNIGYGLLDRDADIPKDKGKMSPYSFKKFKKFVSKYTASYVSKLSGVPEEKLIEAAKLIADPKKKVTSYWTMGVNQHTRGVWMNHLIYNYHLLQGKISEPGSGPFSLTGQPSACGTAREVGTFAHRLPADMVVMNPKHREIAAKKWGIDVSLINPKPGKHTMEMFRAIDRKEIDLLWVQVSNPMHTLPNVSRYREALKRDDCFVIVSDVYPTQTTAVADVVLPSAMYAEKEGAYGNAERRTQHWFASVPPLGDARPETWQMVEVAKRLGFGELLGNHDDPNWHRDQWEEYRSFGLGIGKDIAPYDVVIKEHGVVWPFVKHADGKMKGVKWRYNAKYDPYAADYKKKHPEHKGDIVFYKAKKYDYKAAVLAVPYEPPPEIPDKNYPFWMSTGRVLEHWHTGTMTRRVPELSRAVKDAFVAIHPSDAEKMGIENGDKVKVSSRRGSGVFEVQIEGRHQPQEGLVFIPFFSENQIVNDITLDHYDPMSKEPDYKKCAVKVEKV